MDDEDIQLPALPSTLPDPQLPRLPFSQIKSRKRFIRSDEVTDADILSGSARTSSDPALFSSDETPDAENYAAPKRRKKQTYAGTWWGARMARTRAGSHGLSSDGSSRRGGKRRFTRNFDSGIFMCSDDSNTEPSSDSSFGRELVEEQKRSVRKSFLQQSQSPVRSQPPSPQVISPQRMRVKQDVMRDSKEDLVLSVIRTCVEQCKEDVDLSNMSIDTLPAELRELATIVKDDPADLAQFESLVARPRLYLSNNLIREFPTPILELSNLRLLSIRQNKLTRLPPGIRNLTKLETLNISGNRLQHLPVEVLDLMAHHRLSELHSEPNPWMWYSTNHVGNYAPYSTKRRLSYDNKARRNDMTFDISAGLVAAREQVNEMTAAASTNQPKSSVPRLSELVLRQLSQVNNSKTDLSALLPSDAPPTVTTMLGDLYTAQTEGGRRCACCQRLYINPARRWIEWWRVWVRMAVAENPVSGLHRPHLSSDQTLPFEVGICEACA
ncbi:hypothetical protein LTR64_007975 [Lithohypha guttulata]|uniref:uncharacterized protein n=1 Tax=Lithohypha guttulata TaxID=1690604 RepID=UPI00315CA403